MSEKECEYQFEEMDNGKHKCSLFQEDNGNNCDGCIKKLPLTDEHFIEKWKDPLIVLDRTRTKTDSIHNLLGGGCAFLVGGGPSTKKFALEKLNYRGVFTMGVNNVAAHPRFRASSFVCSDPPKKFSNSIWLDPHCMKFVPSPKMTGRRQKLRMKKNGVFYKSDTGVSECPNIWAFKRHSHLRPDETFFTEEGAFWGNHNKGVKMTGEKKTVCTMLLAMRLLYFLGARRIFLVGVDFLMSPGAVYSFDQGKSDGGCDSNNNQYTVVNDWLCKMEDDDVFGKFGLEIFNCYEHSGLRAFPYVSFEDAIDIATQNVEQVPDLKDWYDKDECPNKECKSWHLHIVDGKKTCLDCGNVWE